VDRVHSQKPSDLGTNKLTNCLTDSQWLTACLGYWLIRNSYSVKNQPTNQPTNQTTNQPTKQPTNQPNNQTTNQTTNQQKSKQKLAD
jgi:hypothetical protein